MRKRKKIETVRRERERVCERERERVCVRERERGSASERERESVCVCEKEGGRGGLAREGRHVPYLAATSSILLLSQLHQAALWYILHERTTGGPFLGEVA